MTQQFTTAIQNFRQYCIGATKPPAMPVFEVATVEDLVSHTKALHTLQSALRASGKEAQLTSWAGKYAALTYGGLTLRVQTPKVAKKTNVAATSIEAYHSIDFTSQRARIAEIIWQHHQGVTRKEIEVYHNFGSNAVTGRVKELLEMSQDKPFLLSGGLYRLQVVGTRLSLCQGASRVPNEVLQWMPVSEPSPVGEQTALAL